MRPLYQCETVPVVVKGYSVVVLTGTDARPCVPTTVTRQNRYSSRFNGDGRSDGLRPTVRPYNRYTSYFDTTDAVTFDTTDAQIVRPYKGLLVLCVPTTTSLAVVALC